MPKMDGFNALKVLREFDPDVRILFVSGYQKQSDQFADEVFKAETVINKPFSIHELSRIIREKIDTAIN